MALIWLGAVAYGLAIYSTQVYRNHAIESQVESLQTVLELKSREVIEELQNTQKRFALQLQSQKPFRQALKDGDARKMEALLNQSYSRYHHSD